jgi:hypothetical protein
LKSRRGSVLDEDESLGLFDEKSTVLFLRVGVGVEDD